MTYINYQYTPQGCEPDKYICKKCGKDRVDEMHREVCSSCGHKEVKVMYKRVTVADCDPNIKDLGDMY